jgi:hypothetical protein
MTPTADLRALSATERTARFHILAQLFYGTSEYAPRLAADLEKSRSTIFAWRRNDNVPLEVIITLEAWIAGPDFAERVMKDWDTVAPDLGDAAMALAKVAQTLKSIGRRMPSFVSAAPHDASASSPETATVPESQ